jgi:hypothetical protein
VHPLRAIALCLLIAASAAEDTAEAELELVVTPGLSRAALAVAPLSLLGDPAAKVTIDHIGAQLAALDGLASTTGLPPLLPLLRGFDGAVLHAAPFGPTDEASPFTSDLRLMALAIDAGGDAEGLSAWTDAMLARDSQRTRWEDFAGYSVGDDFFLGRDGTRFVVGHADHLSPPVQRLAQLAAAPAEPRIALTWRLGPALAAVGGHAPRWMQTVMDDLLGAWRGGAPTMRVRAAPEADGWHGRVAIADLWRLPLEPLDAEVAASARSGWTLAVGLHIDPSTAYALWAHLRTVAEAAPPAALPVTDAAPPAVPGVFVAPPAAAPGAEGDPGPVAVLPPPEAPIAPPPPLVGRLTGDCLAQARWTDALPTGAVLLRLHDGGEAAADLAALAAELGAADQPRAGAEQAFVLALPWGRLVIARQGDRLVVGTAEELLTAWLAGTAGDAPLAAGRIVQVDLDLPAIAQRWLPTAWAALEGVSEPLGDDPLGVADELAWAVNTALSRVPPPESVGAVLRMDDTFIAREDLLRLFPGSDLPAAVDAACAVYVPDPAPPAQEDAPAPSRLVLRFAAGFAILDNGERQIGLDAAALAEAMHGWKRLLGPDPAALVQVSAPEPAVFDRRWLPPLAAVLRHVPAYHLELSDADFVLRAEERGLPAISLAVIALGLRAWGSGAP